MRRVIALELVGQTKLEYDLYDENGEIIYKKGDILSPDFIMMLNFKKVYKSDVPACTITENKESKEQDNKAEMPKVNIIKGSEKPSLISPIAKKYTMSASRGMVSAIYDGKLPNEKECDKAAEVIIEEVITKLDNFECISQLRIYDEYIYSHSVNVASLSAALGKTLNLEPEKIKELTLGAFLHDIGKMKIPREILNKPGSLTKDEYNFIKNHAVYGYEIIKEMGQPEVIAKVALEHQERFSGGGYPNGLKGSDISLYGQISAIADVYDALVSERVYKNSIISPDALRVMLSEGKDSFNLDILNKFVYLAVVQATKSSGGYAC